MAGAEWAQDWRSARSATIVPIGAGLRLDGARVTDGAGAGSLLSACAASAEHRALPMQVSLMSVLPAPRPTYACSACAGCCRADPEGAFLSTSVGPIRDSVLTRYRQSQLV